MSFRRRWLWRWLMVIGLCGGGSLWMLGHSRKIVDRRPGKVIADFALVDVRTGQLHPLSEHRGRVVAIIFTGTNCPVGDLYMPRLSYLSRVLETRDVDFLAINSNASESIEDVAEHARRSEVTFPVLKDPENRVADQLVAERTCEALLIDGRGRLRYRGAIDDQYGSGTRRDNPERRYLFDAIQAVLAGLEVSPATTPVVGCPIERTMPQKTKEAAGKRVSNARTTPLSRPAAASPVSRLPAGQVTYAADVAPILHTRCSPCHRPGQIAPFPLLTYDHARRRAAAIAEVLADGRMPPWHADPRYGRFANDRSLSSQERSLLAAWIEQGTPSGDLYRAPEPPSYPLGWSIGSPDVVYEMPEPFLVPAEGTLPIQHFRLPTHLDEDLWIQAAEIRPSDRAVVHHIFVYMESRQDAKNKQKVFLAAYTPGDVPSIFPPGVAKKISRGSDLTFEVHYTPIGEVRFDRFSVGLILSRQPPRHQAITRGIPYHKLRIPPGAKDHVERVDWTIKSDIQILSFMPHMHLRGKSFTYTALYPDGRTEILLSVPNYDFNWQSVYRLAEPKRLPTGTTIHCEARYDNSAENPANPDPNREVTWGEQTWDEMLIGYLDFFKDEPIGTTGSSQPGGP